MFKKFLFSLSLLLLGTGLIAQNNATLSGYVRDAGSGEDLVGATVVVPELGAGAYTNEYGFYSLTIPQGTYQVEYRYVSFETLVKEVDLSDDVALTVELGTSDVNIEEVQITADAEDENVTSMEMSTVTVDIESIKKMPALFGEVDILKTIQLQPGITPIGEGLSGYNVRGGDSDHNLIQLDEAVVYNPSHVLGFFSVFNADALKSEAKLYKGGIPAAYGGRMASVLDLRMREGNNKSFHGSGGIGAISSRLTFEGPLAKDRSSFIVSARRTYADVFLGFANDEDLRNSQAYFYDVNAKVNYKFSDKDRLFASGYFGRDVLKFRDVFGVDWGNSTATLRWNHLFSDKIFSNTSFIYSDFFYGFSFKFGDDTYEYESRIRDFNLKMDYSWFINQDLQLKFGYNGVLHRINPGQFLPVEDSAAFDGQSLPIEYSTENAVYLLAEHKITDRLSFNYGLRYSSFQQLGPGDEYTYDASGETILDTTTFGNGALIQHWGGLEPRFSARYILDGKSSIKASYNRIRQYMHQASNSAASFPWDLWITSSRHIPPQIGDQVALGYFRNFANNKIEASVEGYYKWMQNQFDFRNGAQLVFNQTMETEFLFGKGWSYGAEFFVKANLGKFNGSIAYTYSRTFRQIKGINDDDPDVDDPENYPDGIPYAANNDRPHHIAMIGMYEFSPVFTFSATWEYYSGRPTTFPKQNVRLGNLTTPDYSIGYLTPAFRGRNSDRIEAFHRLDLSADISFKKKKPEQRFEHGLNISLVNAYGRHNPFSYFIQPWEELTPKQKAQIPNNPNKLYFNKAYLFTWVPSVTWNFSF